MSWFQDWCLSTFPCFTVKCRSVSVVPSWVWWTCRQELTRGHFFSGGTRGQGSATGRRLCCKNCTALPDLAYISFVSEGKKICINICIVFKQALFVEHSRALCKLCRNTKQFYKLIKCEVLCFQNLGEVPRSVEIIISSARDLLEKCQEVQVSF